MRIGRRSLAVLLSVIVMSVGVTVGLWFFGTGESPEQTRLRKLASLLHNPLLMETHYFPAKVNALFRHTSLSEELRRAGDAAVPHLMEVLNGASIPGDEARARAMELLSEIPNAVNADTARRFLLCDTQRFVSSRSAWVIGEEGYGRLVEDIRRAFDLGRISKEDKMLVLCQLGDDTQSEAILSQLTHEIGVIGRDYRPLLLTILYRRIRNNRNLFCLIVPWAISILNDGPSSAGYRSIKHQIANCLLVRMTGMRCPLAPDPGRLEGVDLAKLKDWWSQWWNENKENPIFAESILDIRRATRGTLDPSIWIGFQGGPFYPPDADAQSFDLETYEEWMRTMRGDGISEWN
ncbi:MAG: hypothetical protein RDV41_05885 [Planctomycetota bacterium]|nr:hypothetical protein [Planctomycetota bacterium]